MKVIVVSSSAPYSGKSGVCIVLIGELQRRGFDVGYFKPYGTMPESSAAGQTDRDAAYVNSLLGRPGPDDSVVGAVRTRTFVEDVLAGRLSVDRESVRAAFDRASEGRDVMLVEGPSDLSQGCSVGLSLCEVAELVNGRVLLVEQSSPLALPDSVLHAMDCLKERLVGVVYNRVPEHDRSALVDHVSPFLAARGVATFGTVAYDPMLSSATVGEIVDALGGTLLCAEERVDLDVESFMVGAMGQEKALRFFRRKANKAVITGGDRADVQMAALETSTNLVILTGNLPPSSFVLARADELGVPVLLVDMDTLTAVERMESLMGHVRLHGPGKTDRMREMFAEGVRVDELLAAFGL
ncbi:MAG TPA: phosphotransacetylase family protein [Coriobacteriia bacterium]